IACCGGATVCGGACCRAALRPPCGVAATVPPGPGCGATFCRWFGCATLALPARPWRALICGCCAGEVRGVGACRAIAEAAPAEGWARRCGAVRGACAVRG